LQGISQKMRRANTVTDDLEVGLNQVFESRCHVTDLAGRVVLRAADACFTLLFAVRLAARRTARQIALFVFADFTMGAALRTTATWSALAAACVSLA
jgi:hypothetical protein